MKEHNTARLLIEAKEHATRARRKLAKLDRPSQVDAVIAFQEATRILKQARK